MRVCCSVAAGNHCNQRVHRGAGCGRLRCPSVTFLSGAKSATMALRSRVSVDCAERTACGGAGTGQGATGTAHTHTVWSVSHATESPRQQPAAAAPPTLATGPSDLLPGMRSASAISSSSRCVVCVGGRRGKRGAHKFRHWCCWWHERTQPLLLSELTLSKFQSTV